MKNFKNLSITDLISNHNIFDNYNSSLRKFSDSIGDADKKTAIFFFNLKNNFISLHNVVEIFNGKLGSAISILNKLDAVADRSLGAFEKIPEFNNSLEQFNNSLINTESSLDSFFDSLDKRIYQSSASINELSAGLEKIQVNSTSEAAKINEGQNGGSGAGMSGTTELSNTVQSVQGTGDPTYDPKELLAQQKKLKLFLQDLRIIRNSYALGSVSHSLLGVGSVVPPVDKFTGVLGEVTDASVQSSVYNTTRNPRENLGYNPDLSSLPQTSIAPSELFNTRISMFGMRLPNFDKKFDPLIKFKDMYDIISEKNLGYNNFEYDENNKPVNSAFVPYSFYKEALRYNLPNDYSKINWYGFTNNQQNVNYGGLLTDPAVSGADKIIQNNLVPNYKYKGFLGGWDNFKTGMTGVSVFQSMLSSMDNDRTAKYLDEVIEQMSKKVLGDDVIAELERKAATNEKIIKNNKNSETYAFPYAGLEKVSDEDLKSRSLGELAERNLGIFVSGTGNQQPTLNDLVSMYKDILKTLPPNIAATFDKLNDTENLSTDQLTQRLRKNIIKLGPWESRMSKFDTGPYLDDSKEESKKKIPLADEDAGKENLTSGGKKEKSENINGKKKSEEPFEIFKSGLGVAQQLGGALKNLMTTLNIGADTFVGKVINGFNTALGIIQAVVAVIEAVQAVGSFFKFLGLAEGGVVPGTGNTDSIPAMLTPGEFVVNKNSVNKVGLDFLRWVNNGTAYSNIAGRFSSGGLVQQVSYINTPLTQNQQVNFEVSSTKLKGDDIYLQWRRVNVRESKRIK
ncbi:MAG: hypothetical protein K1X86_12555 [Ignavibacteria bacterium]|nr:hypothetical protein [Ignavibacteria bacterium]